MGKITMMDRSILEGCSRLPDSVVAYRVGDVDQIIDRPVFFTGDREYYKHSQTGYDGGSAERYSIELKGHKVWDPMAELGLDAETWATVWGKVGDFRRLGIEYDYSDDMDDGELPDDWVVYTSTDELAFAGRRLGYDVVVLRDIPGDFGYGPSYDEYAVNDASCLKRLQKLSESLLLERKRSEILNRSRTGDNYKTRPGENRYTRRTKSRVAATVADYNRIDMDAFFKADMLEFDISVKGETDDYTVTVLFENVLKEIKRNVSQNKGKFEFKCVMQALMRVFNSEDIYVACSCKDFVYGGYNYYSFKGNYNSNPQLGKALEKPVIRNPNDTKGDACKHILLCLSNLDWIMKIASVINNYVKYCRDRMSYNYWRYIAPTIYDDVEAQRASDAETKLASDKGTIGKANVAAPTRGRFVKGSNINPAYAGDLADAQRKSGVFSKLNDVTDDDRLLNTAGGGKELMRG